MVKVSYHPQSDFVGLRKPLQKEWAFVQQVTPGIGDAFGPVEKAMQETFFSTLFEVLGEGSTGIGVTRLPVTQVGLVLLDPTLTASENWTAPCFIKGHLVAALRGQVEFWTADYPACL